MTINKFFRENLYSHLQSIFESAQFKATLAITGSKQNTLRENIFHKVGLESIKSRRWFKRLCRMFKII